MKTRPKYGFKKYISKSLPLPNTEIYRLTHSNTLRKGDKVFYYRNSNCTEKRFGYLDSIFGKAAVWCYWENQGDNSTTLGWMPIDSVFVERDEKDVPIINLKFSTSLLEG